MTFTTKLATLMAAITSALMVVALPAHAANDDVFVVVQVPVRAQAESASEAKNKAQSQGRRRAMDILLRRLTPEEDWIYLPRLASFTEAQATGDGFSRSPIVISGEQLIGLESSFEVYGEKSSSALYKAAISYRFKPEAVRRLLKDAGIPYSEAQTRMALVLPVLQTDRNVYLWEENNPWAAAWRARPYTNELTPMIAPLGDLEDRSKVTARGALALDEAGLGALAEQYNVSQVIVAHARLKQVDGKDQLSVRLINGFRDSKSAEVLEQAIAETEFDEDGTLPSPANQGSLNYAGAQEDDFSAETGDILGQAFLSQPSGNFPGLAERLIEASIAKYASGWKAKTLIDHSSEAIIEVSAFFDNIDDWSRIRSALIASPLVGSAQISALSSRGAEMSVRIFGNPARLQVAMENQGVVFWTETGNRWFLARPGVAQRLRGQSFLRAEDVATGRKRSRRSRESRRSRGSDDISVEREESTWRDYDAFEDESLAEPVSESIPEPGGQ
ncbi:MAG: DUF2066 domain-containing protein [Pseudomonadota bacterium]